MTFEEIAPIVNELAIMKYFPGDVDARIGVAKQLACICATADQASWLVTRALALYAEWPGIHELRALYCSRFRPLDGIECVSTVYGDGIPADPALANPLAITGGMMQQIGGKVLAPNDFPRDSLSLIADAVRAHATKSQPSETCHAKPATDQEIERIKSEQAENVKRREAQEAWKRTA